MLSVTMKQTIDGGTLKEAVDEAISRYLYFKVKIVKVGGTLFLEDNPLPLIVRNSAEDIALGTKENNYQLLDIHYFGDELFVNFHHGLCDGNGIFPFVRTLLYSYCIRIYGSAEQLGAVRLPNSPLLDGEDAEPNGGVLFPAEEPKYCPNAAGMYQLPELSLSGEKAYRRKLEISTAAMLPFMHLNDASPSAVVSLLMCKAVEKVHPEHEQPIAASLAWNCRHELGFDNTRRMCLSSICLDYDERTKQATTERQLTYFRGKTFAQQMSENAYKACNGMTMLCNYIDSMKTIEEKCGMLAQVLRGANKSFLVSYIGRMDMGDYEKYIDGVYVYGSGTKGMTLEIVALEDKFSIQLIQSFVGDAYLNAFCEELNSVGITVTVGECQAFTTPRAQLWAEERQ